MPTPLRAREGALLCLARARPSLDAWMLGWCWKVKGGLAWSWNVGVVGKGCCGGHQAITGSRHYRVVRVAVIGNPASGDKAHTKQ